MKHRTSFVSNSSTSSFICSTEMSIREVKKEMNRIVREWRKDPGNSQDFRQDDFTIFIADREFVRDPQNKHYSVRKKAFGKIIIEETSDNSIPWKLFDQIKEIFTATECHLG